MGEGGNKRSLGCECFSAQEVGVGGKGCSSEKSLHNILIVKVLHALGCQLSPYQPVISASNDNEVCWLLELKNS